MTNTVEPWYTANDIAEHLGVSPRHFKTLKRDWIKAGQMVEGDHYKVFGHRTHRFNKKRMHRLAHQMGRIIPSN